MEIVVHDLDSVVGIMIGACLAVILRSELVDWHNIRHQVSGLPHQQLRLLVKYQTRFRL